MAWRTQVIQAGPREAWVPGGFFGGWLGVTPWRIYQGDEGGGDDMRGVTDGSEALPGDVGELIEVNVDQVPVGASAAAATQLAMLTLSPGDWDVQAFIDLQNLAGFTDGWGLLTEAQDFSNADEYAGFSSTSNIRELALAMPTYRILRAQMATLRIVAFGSPGPVLAWGLIRARRMR
jgi:hypothetical protein